MPQRSSRNNNNNTHNGRNSDKYSSVPSQHQQHRTSPPPSPPTHLPTPLPDEQLLSLRSSTMEYSLTGLGLHVGDAAASPTRHVESETGVDAGDGTSTSTFAATSVLVGPSAIPPTRLIDLDTPPPAQYLPLPARAEDPEWPREVEDLDVDADAQGLEGTYIYQPALAYRSPPFREARLPEKQDSPPPLPIPPRASAGPSYDQGREDFGEDEGEGSFLGQTVVSRNATIRMPRVVSPAHRPSLSSPNVSSPPTSSSSRPTSSASPSSPVSQPRSRFGGLPFDAFSIGQALRSSYASPAPPAPPSVSRPVVGYGVFSSSSSGGPSSASGQTGGAGQGVHKRAVSQQEFEREYERYGDDSYGYGYGYQQPQPQQPRSSRPRLEEVGYEHDSVYAQERVAADSHGRHRQHQDQQGQGQQSGLAMAIRQGSSGGGAGARYPDYPDAGEPIGQYRSEEQGRGLRQGKERGKREAEVVSWARWDFLNERRVLMIAYPTSLQIWDCADLKEVQEVLDIDFGGPEWALLSGDGRRGGEDNEVKMRVVHATVLPPPKILPTAGKGVQVDEVDGFRDVRPLLGILMEPADEDQHELEPSSTTFVLYSLRTHQIVKMLSLDGRAMPTGSDGFVANEFVVVIGTTNPPRIHVLSSLTFHTLHIIHSDALEPFYRPVAVPHATQHSMSSTLGVPSALSPSNSSSSQPSMSSTGLLSVERSNSGNDISSSDSLPYPVFALSHRLLAYASPSPGSSSPSPSDTQQSSLFGALTSKARRRLSSSSNTTSASGPSSSHGGASSSVSSSPFGGLGGAAAAGIGKLTGMSTITQADVGHAALKVGESVLGGMRFLGGLAVEAAKSRVSGGAIGGQAGGARLVSVGSGLGVGGSAGGRFVSRSAPDNTTEEMLRDRDRRFSAGTATTPTTTTAAPQTKQVAEQGHYVTVLDLGPILSSDPARDPRLSPASVSRSTSRSPHHQQASAAPRKVDEFLVSRSQPVAGLSFSQDGTSIGVLPRDGHNVKVFKFNPAPGVMVSAYNRATSSSSALASSPEDTIPPEPSEIQIPEPFARPVSQLYDLYRGRTSAVIESVGWSRDGKWVGIGTRNRTVHVFGVNPFGMKPDVVWHLGGRVRDGIVSGVEPRMTQMTPLVRIRGSKSNSAKNVSSSSISSPGASSAVAVAELSRAPLAFTFIPPSGFSNNIQPQNSPRHHPVTSSSFSPTLSPSSPTFSSPTSVHGHAGSKPNVSRQLTQSSTYQDVLLFDPADGVLSLRRLALDKHPVKEGRMGIAIGGLGGGVGAAAAHALGVTSISLPGMGAAGRLSTSPSKVSAGVGSGRDAKRDVGVEQEMELGAKESTVVWWELRRGKEGGDQIKIAFEPFGLVAKGKGRTVGGTDWLAQGEISTCSSSQAVLPRSLYLSHQFSFHTLGEDYHALIRRYQFDIRGDKIEVRKEVEVVSTLSPSSAGVAGGAGPPDAEAFVQDFDMQAPHRHARRVSSSFDEPMASAISGSLQVDSANLPLILPMYPNGVPGSANGPGFTFPHKVLRNAIPIGKGIGRNVNVVGEGIGRIVSAGVGKRGRERERDREGGYSLNDDAHGGELHVPLEFDEEDEDFIVQGQPSESGADVLGPTAPHHATTSESSRDTSLATPGNLSAAHSMMMGMDADVVGRVDEEIWGNDLSSLAPHSSSSAAGIIPGGHRQEGSLEDDNSSEFFARGWDRQDRLAVEEQEGYDDLGIVGAGGRVQMRGQDGGEEVERGKEKERKRKVRPKKR